MLARRSMQFLTTRSLVARHCLFRIRSRYKRQACSVNRLIWFCMVCVDIWALWRPGVFAVVFVGGLHRSQRWTSWICQYYVDVVTGGLPLRGIVRGVLVLSRRCLNTQIDVCHMDVWRHLQPPSFFAAYPLPFSVGDGETRQGPGKIFFVSVMASFKMITYVQMRGFTYQFNSTKWKLPIISLFHEGFCNPCLAVLIWSTA